jgi:hypothetical protein
MSDQLITRPLPKHRTTQTQNKHIHTHQTSMPWVGFKSTILASEQAKTVHALVHLATMTSPKVYIFFRPLAPTLKHRADFSVSWSFYTDGRIPWTDDQLIARPLPKHRTTQTHKNTHTHTPNIHTLDVGFEPTIPASERAKTVHALDRSATVTSPKVYNMWIFIINIFKVWIETEIKCTISYN